VLVVVESMIFPLISVGAEVSGELSGSDTDGTLDEDGACDEDGGVVLPPEVAQPESNKANIIKVSSRFLVDSFI